MEEIILASASPRRKQIFQQMQLPFRVIPPDSDEENISEEDIKKRVIKLSYRKGLNVYSRIKKTEPLWIASFDTLIEINGKILGKSFSEKNARETLQLLSGKIHNVYTGIALFSAQTGKWDTRTAKSEVKLINMEKKEIDFYISTGEWQGVAGCYRIQQQGALFIEWIKGCYSNIVGLPISLFYGMLRYNNYSFSLRQGN